MMLEESIFPIQGPLRDHLLLIEWIVVFFALEWALIFTLRVLDQKKNLKSLQEKAYISLFLSYSLMWVFTIIADYYAESRESRLHFLNIGYFIMIIGVLFFIFNMERYKIFYKKYFFSSIFILSIVMYIIIAILWPQFTNIIYSILWVIFIIIFLISLKDLSKNSTLRTGKRGFYKIFIKFSVAFSCIIFGFGFALEYSIMYIGLDYRLLGGFLQLIGIILVSLFFIYSIPSLTEYTWKNKVESIFLTHKSGLLIYKKSFTENEDNIDATLISGELTTLKMMLEYISKKKGEIVLQKKGKTLLIVPGQFITGVLICESNLKSLRIILKNLISNIESIYSEILPSWKGDMKVLSPIKDMIREFFK